ncbi:MAG TPA: NAD-dependent epimerase/dehydratase family protein [Actinocrinis sp.]|jgi:nucleoside-diphosphate-sugar epimerase|uniref:NAD-dependent epimerase/dehydratase family protein n=1 Tax=Actinocrinis sp. TaxID=1920516 RepID=UPI002DDD2563|nr:NAD-dependent epimerase/dehydratase family protein [Actinocrinis sp.]HEV3168812.1 NAD-dependent epimerase/dehydratase family protein [Actinocrinis sp.]
MSLHVIVGAGPVGTATAKLLAERDEEVRIVTRRGGGPAHANIERVAADATDADRLTDLTRGAAALYNCASPLYHRWFTDWPPLAAAFLTAAERTGAVLATASNLYGYGPVTGPITPETPLSATHPKLKLRADMFRDAMALHEAGRIRATEVRASDYIEANSVFSYIGEPLLAGKRAYIPAALDVPHSWTSIPDVAATLVTAATDERALGKAWLVPTNPPLTVRQLATRFTEVNGAPKAKISALPYPVLWSAGLVSPMMRELRATHYQFVRPFVIDTTLTEQTFGLKPSDLDAALRNVGKM